MKINALRQKVTSGYMVTSVFETFAAVTKYPLLCTNILILILYCKLM